MTGKTADSALNKLHSIESAKFNGKHFEDDISDLEVGTLT